MILSGSAGVRAAALSWFMGSVFAASSQGRGVAVRTETTNQITTDESEAKAALLRVKMREAMAKMVAAAKARRARTGHANGRGRLKAALSPARWRAGAGRWLPARMRADAAVVLSDTSPRAIEAEAAIVADALMRLPPAMGRAAVYGEPVTIRVPDRRAAEVFRLALQKTSAERVTDRLVRIVVAEK
jgi:hypothetical protein